MSRLAFVSLIAVLVCLVWAAAGQQREEPARLPDGRLQSEAILQADHEKNLEDAAQLVRLSEELKVELEKNDRHVLSVAALKKTEEIEKIAKRIRSRLRRH